VVKKKAATRVAPSPSYKSVGICYENSRYYVVVNEICGDKATEVKRIVCSNWTAVIERFKILALDTCLKRNEVRGKPKEAVAV